MDNAYYNGSIISHKHKEEMKFFYIEELFSGDFIKKAPITLRKKIDKETMEDIEIYIRCFFGAPSDSKIAFRNYYHFREVLEEVGLNLKKYLK